MSRKDEAAAQTAIRKQLLANGYTPLANDDKRCMLPGWSRLVVDEQLIDEWSEQLRYRATGIRLEHGVAMIDIDVNDDEIIDKFLDAIPDDLWEVLKHCPVRYGKGAKQAWLFRTETPFLRYASGAFARPGEDPEGDDVVLHRVEVFGGKGGGRQMGAFGAHTVEGGEVKVAYRWEGRSPLDIRAEDLPILTEDDVAELCDIATEVMQLAGWTRHTRSKSGKTDDGGLVKFDLTEDMVFDTQEFGEIAGLGELKKLLEAEERLRLSASWLEGPAARNKTRCIASLDHSGEVAIFETAEFLTHKAERLKPKLPTDTMADRLREMAAKGTLFSAGTDRREPVGRPAGGDEDRDELDAEDILQQAADILLQEYAFAPDQDKPVFEIRGTRRMSLGNFKVMCRPYAVQRRGPRGGVQTINPADIWLDSAMRIEVCGRRFLPRTRDLLVWSDLDNALAINLYRPAQHTASPRRLDVWQRFMEHLLPDDRERAWFMNWLAAKVQKPWLPNCGVIMVAPRQGTGRGTLFDILRGVFGPAHVRNVNSMQLMGHGGQGQYTEWLEDALLVTCDEVLAGGDTSGNMMWKRQEAYERLKTLVDPRARVASIVRKGEANFEAEVFASFLMATNNLNALPLAEDDRRLAVLQNAALPMLAVPGLLDLMDEVRSVDAGYDAGFLSAIHADLMSRTVDWAEAREAPLWAVQRLSMLEANKSDLDEVLEGVLSELPGDYILSDDLRKRLGVAIDAAGLKDELKGWWNRARDILRQGTAYGWTRMQVRQHVQDRTVKEKRATVYYRDAPGVMDAWTATPEADRPALWQEGSDLNATLSRARRVMREKGWTVE